MSPEDFKALRPAAEKMHVTALAALSQLEFEIKDWPRALQVIMWEQVAEMAADRADALQKMTIDEAQNRKKAPPG